MPHYTPAQRRALSTLPAFRDEFSPPSEPPPDPMALAHAEHVARVARLLARPLPASTPAMPSLAEAAAAMVAADPQTRTGVVAFAAGLYRVDARDVCGKDRRSPTVAARAVAGWGLRRMGLTYQEVARTLGASGHAAIMCAAKRVADALSENEWIATHKAGPASEAGVGSSSPEERASVRTTGTGGGRGAA